MAVDVLSGLFKLTVEKTHCVYIDFSLKYVQKRKVVQEEHLYNFKHFILFSLILFVRNVHRAL